MYDKVNYNRNIINRDHNIRPSSLEDTINNSNNKDRELGNNVYDERISILVADNMKSSSQQVIRSSKGLSWLNIGL